MAQRLMLVNQSIILINHSDSFLNYLTRPKMYGTLSYIGLHTAKNNVNVTKTIRRAKCVYSLTENPVISKNLKAVLSFQRPVITSCEKDANHQLIPSYVPRRQYCLRKVHRTDANMDCPPPPPPLKKRDSDFVEVKLGTKKLIKKLRPIPNSNCECVDPPPLKTIELKRLPKKRVPEPDKVCMKALCKRAPMPTVVPKVLPRIGFSNCPCVEPEPLRDVELKPLPKKSVPEPPKICPKIICDRKNIKEPVKPKVLPKLGVSNCPCIEPTPLRDFTFKRLPKKVIPEPPKICPESLCKPKPKVQIPLKVLPKIGFSNCPCVEPEPLRDVDLKPLPKRTVPEPPKICPKSLCKEKPQPPIIPKELPKIPVSNCPCIEPEIPTLTPKMTRLPKCPETDPPKCKKKGRCDDMPRADKDDWTYSVRRQYSTFTNSGFDIPQVSSTTTVSSRIIYVNGKRLYSTKLSKNVEKVTLSPSLIPSLYSSIIDANRKIAELCRTTIRFNAYLPMTHNTKRPIMLNDIKIQDISMETQQLMKYIRQSTEKIEISINKVLSKTYVVNTKNQEIHIHSADSATPTPICEKLMQAEKMISAKDKQLEMSLKCLSVTKNASRQSPCGNRSKYQKSMWQKIVSYFQARPCPTPAELRRMRLREEARVAAKRAGMCIYDPKELEERQRRHLPKIITAEANKRDDC